MPTSSSPTVQRRRLAAELRRLRMRSGKTADEVAKVLGWSKAKISRYELAQSGLRPADVASLVDFYGVHGEQRAQLLTLAEAAGQRGWWEAYSDIVSPEQLSFIGLEAEAMSLRQWQVSVVPGLLQTQDYARQILMGHREVIPLPPSVIERRVETRLIRQQLLTRDPPLEVSAIMDESILLRQVGDHSVMDAQLQRLAEASSLPNVRLQIMPLRSRHRLLVDSFVILQFAREHEATLHDVVSIETLSSQLYFKGEVDTYEFMLTFEYLADTSLTPEESRELILRTAHYLND